jgi:predicted Zn-dependent protease
LVLTIDRNIQAFVEQTLKKALTTYEAAADRGGFKLIEAARIDPAGMIRFFEKVQQEFGRPASALKYLSTHPSSEDRIQQLKRLTAEATYTPVPLVPGFPWRNIATICPAEPAR